MIIFALVFIVISLALVIFYVTRPLFLDQQADNMPVNSHGQEEYASLLEQIRELDFDFNLGKMTADEHTEQRNDLLKLAAAARNKMQTIENTPPSAP